MCSQLSSLFLCATSACGRLSDSQTAKPGAPKIWCSSIPDHTSHLLRTYPSTPSANCSILTLQGIDQVPGVINSACIRYHHVLTVALCALADFISCAARLEIPVFKRIGGRWYRATSRDYYQRFLKGDCSMAFQPLPAEPRFPGARYRPLKTPVPNSEGTQFIHERA